LTVVSRESRNGKEPFDVIILGTGQAGSHLGTILAGCGVRVLLLDRDEHPRFAVGESTVPHTSMMLRILAARYGVPEIEHCSSLAGITANIASTCGIKRNFGFVYHRPGERQQPEEATQAVISESLHGPESHLFRQDIDAYALVQAVQRGAQVRQKRNLVGIDIDGSGVRLEDERGEVFRGRYLVDACGFRSPLAKQYDLRPATNPLKTHSRTLFTHMVDVDPYEETTEPPGVHNMPRKWSQGTLHHIFAGGWLWVIPFNNHPDSTNPLISVGLTLDPRLHPQNGETPEEEFTAFLSRFPDIQKQFRNAKSVREWVGTGRLQYTATRSTGDRFCLISHSAGFIDALFSRGLANTMEIINALAGRLVQALTDDDLSAERFEYIDRLQQSLITYNDRLVACSFTAFSDFGLWNAWYRIWVLGAFLGWLRLTRAYRKYQEGAGPGVFDALEDAPHPGCLCPGLEEYASLFEATATEVEAVSERGAPPDRAAARILELIRQSEVVPPVLALDDLSKRHTPLFDLASLLDLFRWFKGAPEPIRRWYAAV
jgi:FADH2 O2-dependent halogenase